MVKEMEKEKNIITMINSKKNIMKMRNYMKTIII